ncbi:MAG: hypothetical protein AAB401_02775 [Acidobacteriota bacterium]
MMLCERCGESIDANGLCPSCDGELSTRRKRWWAIASPKAELSRYVSPSRDDSILSQLDKRLTTVGSSDEALQWAEVRRQVMEQIEDAEERQFQRALLKRQLQYRWGFSLLAFASGLILSVMGYDAIGIFTTGAGLSVFAKDWVMAWIKGGQTDESNEE